MAQSSRRKTGYMVYIPFDVMEELERRVDKGERSQWIVETIRARLDRERDHPKETER